MGCWLKRRTNGCAKEINNTWSSAMPIQKAITAKPWNAKTAPKASVTLVPKPFSMRDLKEHLDAVAADRFAR